MKSKEKKARRPREKVERAEGGLSSRSKNVTKCNNKTPGGTDCANISAIGPKKTVYLFARVERNGSKTGERGIVRSGEEVVRNPRCRGRKKKAVG